MQIDFKKNLIDNLNYLIIVSISLIAMFFLPMLDSHADIDFEWPHTVSEWIIYLVTRITIAIINVIIFNRFMDQGKQNVRNDPKYIEACELLEKVKLQKKHLPESPTKWQTKEYGKKLTFLTAFSLLSLVSLGEAILNFDIALFLSAIFTVVMAIVFGLIQMKKAEYYWSEEFWLYAKLVYEESQNKLNSEVLEENEIIIKEELENAKMG